jgi:hypothetical protein
MLNFILTTIMILAIGTAAGALASTIVPVLGPIVSFAVGFGLTIYNFGSRK